MIEQSLKFDSDPSGAWAATATLCFPESNRNGSVVAEIPLRSPLAPVGTGIEPNFTRFGIPLEIS
jgi:hypothetical protein